jgi:hypothetical protein
MQVVVETDVLVTVEAEAVLVTVTVFAHPRH